MDYPSDPAVGLLAGKFTDGVPGTQDPSIDPASHANAITDEILYVITQNGLTPAEATLTQLYTAIQAMVTGASPPAADVELPRNYVAGLTLSNAGDADHDITIALGVARSTDNTTSMDMASAITKRIDAAWAVGNNAGGLDTGSVAADTWYHLFVIHDTGGPTTDALFSTSATAPTMPAGYTKKRRIGAVLTDGSANIIQFTQVGDRFLWDRPIRDVVDAGQSTSFKTRTLSVPPGVRCLADLRCMVRASGKDDVGFLIQEMDADATHKMTISDNPSDFVGTGDHPPNMFRGQMQTETSATMAGSVLVLTDASGRVRTMSNTTLVDFELSTVGYTDYRGRND